MQSTTWLQKNKVIRSFFTNQQRWRCSAHRSHKELAGKVGSGSYSGWNYKRW